MKNHDLYVALILGVSVGIVVAYLVLCAVVPGALALRNKVRARQEAQAALDFDGHVDAALALAAGIDQPFTERDVARLKAELHNEAHTFGGWIR